MSLFCRTQRKIFWRKFVTRLFWGTIDLVGKKNTMEVNGAPELLCFPHSSEYLPLCSAEQRHSYRFGTTCIFIFGWTITLITSSGDLKCSFSCWNFQCEHTNHTKNGVELCINWDATFVSSSEQIWRNLALHHLFTSGSSAVNGCHQNESPNSW